MSGLVGLIGGLGSIVLIVFGFGLVVFVHELGHFVAARWAGVRVMAFAVGFGPAVVSWRRGLGLRRGSSAAEYERLEYTAQSARGDAGDEARSALSGRVSPTEYRLNWLPLGGYVKMLGQDDADPSHRSAEPDSYNSVAIWKRMVIISAGVVANLVSAAALFVVVFSMGLETPAAVVGSVVPGSAAAEAEVVGDGSAGLGRGLRAGDRLVRVGGAVPRSFNDVMVGVMTASPGEALPVVVDRPGVGEVSFLIRPERSEMGVLEAGIAAAGSTRLVDAPELVPLLSGLGLGPVGPGWRMTSVDGERVSLLHEIEAAADAGGGEAVLIGFEGPGGASHEALVATAPALETVRVSMGDAPAVHASLAGFVPVMMVGEAEEGSARSGRGFAQGLRTGDVFVRLGGYEYPNAAEGVLSVRAAAGGPLPATVWRDGELVDVTLDVRTNGTVGFLISETDSADDARVATLVSAVPGDGFVRPGTRVESIGGERVDSFRAMAERLQGLARSGGGPVSFELGCSSPLGDGVSVDVELSEAESDWLRSMGWSLPMPLLAVEPETTELRSSGPIEAVGLGLAETRRIMTMTYLTFVRLAQGSIAPRVLNGPVGIVHTGTTLADRGAAWLLFFFALVSVNLAVINFLPIPITDGGHMVFLLWEQVTGKPVSIAVQNVATLAGLVLIVGVFLFVTYHDIARLLGS